MDTFTLLKCWIDRLRPTHTSTNDFHITTVTSSPDQIQADNESPFIDLELAVPENDFQNKHTNHLEQEEEETEGVCSNSGEKEKEMTAELTDVLLHGNLLSVNSYSLSTEEKNEIAITRATTSLLLKSVTKFRVFFLRLKRSKHMKEQTVQEGEEDKNDKFFTVKIKVKETPTSPSTSSVSKTQGGDEKKLSKEIIQRYVKMVKPISIRVSKRYAGKLRFSGEQAEAQSSQSTNEQEIKAPAPIVVEEVIANTKGMRIVAGLLMTRKRLRIRRSSSATVAAAPSTAAPPRRRDDSLREQHDGIQSAILHCKRSLNPIPTTSAAAAADSAAAEMNLGRAEKEEFEDGGMEMKKEAQRFCETPLLDKSKNGCE